MNSSTARYVLTIARLEELAIQYFSPKTARHEKPNKEDAFQQPFSNFSIVIVNGIANIFENALNSFGHFRAIQRALVYLTQYVHTNYCKKLSVNLFEKKDSKAMGKDNFRGIIMDYIKYTEELYDVRQNKRALRQKRDDENAKYCEHCEQVSAYFNKQ
ncbi:hypothetical protein T4B_13885 [Trichinella pseudospiralis]|uniref:Uncharacterized protein n=1 Tax=Trichinella pseudospiralis TaxID=6337 RepID=A0A0V1J459_TRIPS|nr:hypothetical protein T4B_13885 [Trichinella pseudospiralis]